jgi:hypothetical protein
MTNLPRSVWLQAADVFAVLLHYCITATLPDRRSVAIVEARKVAVLIGAVVFDVGECLINETREYGTWADWLGVPRHVCSAVFGAIIARGRDYRGRPSSARGFGIALGRLDCR